MTTIFWRQCELTAEVAAILAPMEACTFNFKTVLDKAKLNVIQLNIRKYFEGRKRRESR
jgi:hypothetical protein